MMELHARPRTEEPLRINGRSLSIDDIVEVARHRRRVQIDPAAVLRVERARALVDWLVERGEKVYGLTTGFGKLRDIPIRPEETKKLQRNLIRSHAAGVGRPFPEDVVRAAIVLRANTLCRGHSGIRLSVLQALLDLLNEDVYPFVPEQGSVGCSGDLAPLSHLALVLIGDAEAQIYAPPGGRVANGPCVNDARFSDFQRLDAIAPTWSTFRPVTLDSKEGLALNNGTQVMTAIGALAVHDAFHTLRIGEMAAAMSLEANRGVRTAYRDEIHRVRPQTHQLDAARRVIACCAGSQILDLYLNSAWCRRARRHAAEASDSLIALQHAIQAQGEAVPDPVSRLGDELGALQQTMDESFANPGAAALGEWSAESPRKQIERFNRRLRPLRQRVAALLQAVQKVTFPQGDDTQRLDEALVKCQGALRNAVPTAPLVQDDYSFRCFPQVIGCAWRALEHVHDILVIEANSATDNPLLFPSPPPGVSAATFATWDAEEFRQSLDGDPEAVERCRDAVVGGGNFHGEPIAIAMDYLAIAMAEAANIAERRVAHLVDENLSQGLPPFLVDGSGLNSGFMIPQYTAAALVSENKILCHPASVDSIPTCANSEDHNSMGTIAARKAATVVENVRQVVAIELFAAHQALRFREPLLPGEPIRKVIQFLDGAGVARFEDDIVMHTPMVRARAVLENPDFLDLLPRWAAGPSSGGPG